MREGYCSDTNSVDSVETVIATCKTGAYAIASTRQHYVVGVILYCGVRLETTCLTILHCVLFVTCLSTSSLSVRKSLVLLAVGSR